MKIVYHKAPALSEVEGLAKQKNSAILPSA